MNYLFENKTVYSKEEYLTFEDFHNGKYSLSYHLYTLVVIFMLIFCMILQFQAQNITLTFVFFISLLLFIGYRVFHPIELVTKEIQSEKVQTSAINIFTFYPNVITVTTKQGAFDLPYQQLHRVFETSTNFYLYLNKNHSFLLSKQGFTYGNASDFSSFIKKKVSFRFKKEKTKN